MLGTFGLSYRYPNSHRPDGAACWLCVCDCETQRVVTGRDLYAGRTQSCGCLRKERIAQRYARERGPLKLLKQESRWRRMPSIHVTRAVERPRQHAARDDAILALAKMGLHRDAIAHRMSISRNTVHGVIWRARRRGELITPPPGA